MSKNDPPPTIMQKFSINETDTQKLHTENLQLRNQQFFLGTLALTGSGIASWIVPSVIAANNTNIEEHVLLSSTIAWLLMLGYLHFWSLRLRKIMTVIACYLKARKLSHWEVRFEQFDNKHRRVLGSQTLAVHWMFIWYGLLVVGGAMSCSISEHIDVSARGFWILAGGLVAYITSLVVMKMIHNYQNNRLKVLCAIEFKLDDDGSDVLVE